MSAFTGIIQLILLALEWIKRQTIKVQAQKDLSDDVVAKQKSRVDDAIAAGRVQPDGSGIDPNDRAHWNQDGRTDNG